MWVFIRPRGGQDYYLLMCENRVGAEFCPIHRFDGKHQIPKFFRSLRRTGSVHRKEVNACYPMAIPGRSASDIAATSGFIWTVLRSGRSLA